RRRRNRLVKILKPLSLVMTLALLFGVVWLRSTVVSLEYKLSELECTQKILARDNKLLAADKAKLSSIGRFDSTGHGFIIPDRVQVVYVKQAGAGDAYKASYSVK
ncbi:MAG TPA: hypothetical protein VLD40_03575, partial [Dissulfurispiraceae bacterium]|nr:hypothetical protein [Dissulfurispiraceae bacterium]